MHGWRRFEWGSLMVDTPHPVFGLCFSATVLFHVVKQALHHVEAVAVYMKERWVIRVGCTFTFVEAVAHLVPRPCGIA